MTQTRSQETRKKILNAAYELFSLEGYDATGVAEICQRAGVSKGAFYHHFASKTEVFQELMQEWLSGLDRAFQAISAQTQNVPQAIIQMAGAAGSLLKSNEVQLAILLEFWRQSVRSPELWQVTIEPYRRYRRFFTEMISKGISNGEILPVDPELTGATMVSLALGMLLQALFDPQGADWGDEIVRSTTLFMERLGVR